MQVLVALAVFLCAANAQLWGVTPQNQLIQLNPQTGLWTLQGAAFADHHVTPLIQVADIDESLLTFYFIGVNRTDNQVTLDLIGLSADNGQITSDITLPYHFSFNYIDTPGLDYIPGSNDVLVYGPHNDGQTYRIFRITPTTGKSQLVASWPKNPDAVIQSVDAFDAANNILWLQLEQNNQINTLGFDILTGNLTFNTSDTFGMQSLNYDSNHKQTVGLGKPVNGNTPLVALDGTTGQYTQIATVQGSYTIAGPDNAGLDVLNRQLYQYVDNGSTIELLVVNIDQGTTSTVAYTSGSSVLPNTIAFYN